MASIFFSCLITLSRISSTALNRSDESRHVLFLFLILEEKLSGFCHWVWCLLWVFLYLAFITWRYFSYIPNMFSVFIMKGCWILSTSISASIGMITQVFPSILLMWHITSIDFHMLNYPCIPGLIPLGCGVWSF